MERYKVITVPYPAKGGSMARPAIRSAAPESPLKTIGDLVSAQLNHVDQESYRLESVTEVSGGLLVIMELIQ